MALNSSSQRDKASRLGRFGALLITCAPGAPGDGGESGGVGGGERGGVSGGESGDEGSEKARRSGEDDEDAGAGSGPFLRSSAGARQRGAGRGVLEALQG